MEARLEIHMAITGHNRWHNDLYFCDGIHSRSSCVLPSTVRKKKIKNFNLIPMKFFMIL